VRSKFDILFLILVVEDFTVSWTKMDYFVKLLAINCAKDHHKASGLTLVLGVRGREPLLGVRKGQFQYCLLF
jgi:hypothetical protein